jgi:hypothetical protein
MSAIATARQVAVRPIPAGTITCCMGTGRTEGPLRPRSHGCRLARRSGHLVPAGTRAAPYRPEHQRRRALRALLQSLCERHPSGPSSRRRRLSRLASRRLLTRCGSPGSLRARRALECQRPACGESGISRRQGRGASIARIAVHTAEVSARSRSSEGAVGIRIPCCPPSARPERLSAGRDQDPAALEPPAVEVSHRVVDRLERIGRGMQRDLTLRGQRHQLLEVGVGADQVADERDLA